MNFKRFHESKNLFDEAYPDISGTIRYRAIFVGDGTFTLSTTTPYDSSVANVFLISGNVSSGASTPNNGAWLKHNVTTQSIDGYVTIAYRHYAGTTSPVDCQTMLNLGSTLLPYEPYGNTWHNTSHYIHNTSTDIIATLPAVIYPTGTTATVGLKGNMSQTGTPTPDNPIQPSECGDKTANLFDSSSISLVPVSTSATRNGTNLGILPQGDYVLSATATTGATQLYRTIKDGNNYTFETIRELPYTFTADGTSEQIIRTSGSNFTSWASTGYTNIMLNLGSTALPFEPFGVKIPISSASTTTPVYLGEVESTRRIRKLVLTGSDDENWLAVTLSTNDCIFRLDLSDYPLSGVAPISTHYIGSTANLWVNVANNEVTTSIRSLHAVAIHHSGLSGVTDWKAYLAQQYAAGTPVTIWYVLAEPTTGIVNEPLRKIGDYADEVSGITIPTIAGANTLSVDTTLQPSEVTVNYHGWHPVSAVHERENGAWT